MISFPFVTVHRIEEFKAKFPQADNFLRMAQLEGELEYLETIKDANHFTPWQKARLADLRQWNQERVR